MERNTKNDKNKMEIKSVEIRFSTRTINCFPDRNDRFVIGIRGFKDEWIDKVLCLIIHESFHINTECLDASLKGTNYRFDSIEIATCVLTNILIGRLNRRFHTNYLNIRFERRYREYEKYELQLRKLFFKKNNYEDFRNAIKQQYLYKRQNSCLA